MKDYQKRLMNHLREDNRKDANIPLQNVKNAMGSIQFAKGNPLTKTEITLNVTLHYVDSATNLQVLPAALPARLKTSVPVFLFGLTDYYGAYIKSNTIINTLLPYTLLGNTVASVIGIKGFNFNASTIPLVNTYIDDGDMAFLWVDTLSGIITVVAIKCQNVSYGTFLNSFVSDLITVNTMRFVVPIANVNQYVFPVIFGYQSLFGKTVVDTVDPRMFIKSTDFQQQIADIPVNLPIDKAAMVGFQMIYDCTALSIILFVEKVESLTHVQVKNLKYK